MILEKIKLVRDGRALVNQGDLPIEPGKVTVIFGASGSGKSTLLYALADLDETVRLSTGTGIHPLKEKRVGLVPQQSAVFEDLGTAANNIAFAHDHARVSDRGRLDEAIQRAETALGVQRHWRFPLSGGQKQRVAIGRALAGRADVLLCDEPTAGLDPASRNEAIQSIRRAAAEGVAVVVVTHDLEWNAPDAADLAVVLRENALRPHVPGHTLAAEWFRSAGNATGGTAPVGARLPAWLRAAERVGRSVWWLLLFPFQIAAGLMGRHRVAPRWFLHHLRHYGRITLGISSWVYLIAGGALVGFAGAYFSIGALGVSPHLKAILYPELLAGSALGSYRVLIPLITALLVSAKCGSAIAADIGNRHYGGQIAVMRTLGANPETHLLFSIMLMLAVGMPVLGMLAFAAASGGSLAAFLIQFPAESVYAWRVDYFRLLMRHGLWLDGTGWNIAKLALCGAGVGLIAYRAGVAPKASHTDIGRDISGATLWSSLWCLLVFMLFALIEF